MRRTLMAMVVLGGLMMAAPEMADARVGVWLGLPGVSIFTGPPAPPPYYYAPPAYYAPPPVAVVPPYWGRPYYPYYGPRHRGWRGVPPGWHKHGHKHGRW